MKYYKADISGNCSFKLSLEHGEDANKLVRDWAASQNKGQAKSDRIFVKSVKCIHENDFNNLELMEMSCSLLKPFKYGRANPHV